MLHKPVLLQEVLEVLALKPGAVVVDGTFGSGGHAREILKQIGEKGRLIGIDQDTASHKRCEPLLTEYPQLTLHHENFENADKILDFLNIPGVDAVILDVGFSSDQLEDAGRGFSFERGGPLDMRMNPEGPVTAADLVNDLSQSELEKLFREFGEEPKAERFARAICAARSDKRIETTEELVKAIEEALPRGLRFEKGRRPSWARRHPATKIFQALRIAVNRELEVLDNALTRIWARVKPGGRFAVISFHSLEDRIVKHRFRSWKMAGETGWLTKKPITASREEELTNPRSRSAKLRAAEKKL